jgi:hypothetical protein
MTEARKCRCLVILIAVLLFTFRVAVGQETGVDSATTTFDELKVSVALRSSYRKQQQPVAVGTEGPEPQMAVFRKDIQPILAKACVQCHGPETQEGNLRIDTLDPNLLHGDDVDWWLEVMAVLSNGEMPPADEGELTDKDRSKIVEWLSSEVQVASTVRRAEQGHSSFRRMTRYEYNYVLQDLLGLPYDFAKDLPPEAASEDGFQNSSEMLHMSVTQFSTYRDSGLSALKKATVKGEQPAPINWGVSMQAASADEWEDQDKELQKIRKENRDDPDKLKQEVEQKTAEFQGRTNGVHYKELSTGRAANVSWDYHGAKHAWPPMGAMPEVPTEFDHVVIIPPRQKLIVELGDTVPDKGTLRVRVRASRASIDEQRLPSLQLEFGWQASNDSQASVRISDHDIVVDAEPGQPEFYHWDVPLSEVYPRNSVSKISKMGDLPSPSEYIKLVNSSASQGDIQIDYIEITAPVYDTWPQESHKRTFFDSANQANESVYAREVLTRFMTRAWRRHVTDAEVDQKLALFQMIRPEYDDFQQAMIEVLATVLASPKFLYLVQADSAQAPADQVQTGRLSQDELATRLSMFLWCSTPDEELLNLAKSERLGNLDVLTGQVERMLADGRSRRFSQQFVQQWLGMELLDFLKVDRKVYPQFDPSLKEAMQEEPISFFHEVLQNNHSVLDFLHADYAMVNERLARHYDLYDVYGNHFRRVPLDPQNRRGGILTQAGLLAMNSDGKDSHPLKRGIWMLESLLNDPPPPPPPAVPVIDLADPEIAKLTLKQRIENHRDQPACLSCHAKIDPWGIAFENFDAVGSWRTEIQGQPVDASSLLFNGQRLDGIDALKRFLLENRQDQFARALVHKMTTYALGRPLTFGDRASVDQITADLRRQDDGLATMVTLLVNSDLFQSK